MMMDSLQHEILNDSAFDIANSMIQSDLNLNNTQSIFTSLGSPAYHSRIDFSDRLDEEDLFNHIQGPIAAAAGDCHKDLSTRLRRRKASQPQRLVYCDLNFTSQDDGQGYVDEANSGDMHHAADILSQESAGQTTEELQSGACVTGETTESEAGGLKCDSCAERFPNKKSLRSHKKVHAVQKCVCPVCGLSLFNKAVLKKHVKRIHERPERSFTCEVCEKKFVSRAELHNHSLIHAEEKNFTCETCGKKFATKSYLEKHHKTHAGIRKAFTCEVCHKQLADKTGFTAHVRAHKNERPFACNVCDKRYTIKRHLTSHMRIHSAVRPFRCEVQDCGKTFRSRSNLRMHKDFHAGVKRFTCSHCDRSFLSQGNMAKHVRRHIGNRKYSCDVCGKAFIEKQELKSHQKVHNDVIQADPSSRSTREKPVLNRSCSVTSQEYQSQESSPPCEVTSSLTPDSMVMITVIEDGHVIEGQPVLATDIDTEVPSASASLISYPEGNFIASEADLSSDQLQRLPSIGSFQYHVSSDPVYSCTLCSDHYPQAASLREHLISYHRVEADKIH